VFVGTDEDLRPFRTPVTVLDGRLAGKQVDAAEFSFTKQVASFPDEMVNGPTVFGGYGWPGDPVPRPPLCWARWAPTRKPSSCSSESR
jgi:hypothetical protein